MSRSWAFVSPCVSISVPSAECRVPGSQASNSALGTFHSTHLLVYRMPQRVLGRFHQRLGQRRMRMHRLRDRLRRCFELERAAAFDDELRRFWADDVDAENFIVL